MKTSELHLKVVNLNCWGVFIPFATVNRRGRLDAICSKLSEGYYDIICLQEIWTMEDYKKFKNELKASYKFSHYFHSNVIGSGCCIFTKLNIKSTLFFKFSLNGYPHAVHHGDWYGGKGVGLAVLESPDEQFIINVYITHFVARYQHLQKNDNYHFHRISQCHEMGEFVNLTSANTNCDAIIVSGDFNMNKETIGMQMLLSNTDLLDTWYDRTNCPSDIKLGDITTCDRPDSPFCNKVWQKWYPYGERLDYTFYKSNSKQVEMVCTDCFHVLKEIPGDPNLHYSDHVGVESNLSIRRIPEKNPPLSVDAVLKDAIEEIGSTNNYNTNGAQERTFYRQTMFPEVKVHNYNYRHLYTRGLECVKSERVRITSSRMLEFFIGLIFLACIFMGFPSTSMISSPVLYRILMGLEGIACAICFIYSLGIRRSELYSLYNMEQYFSQKLALCVKRDQRTNVE